MALIILIISTLFFSLLPLIYLKKKYNFWEDKKKYLIIGIPILILALVSIVAYQRFNYFYALLLMSFCGVLYSIALIDFKTKTIDSWLMLSLLLIALLSLISSNWIGSLFKVGTALIVFGMMFLISRISKGVGFGDVKLFGVIALLLDFDMFFATIFYGLVISLLFGIILIKRKKTNMKYELPFAPFVSIGMILTILLLVV